MTRNAGDREDSRRADVDQRQPFQAAPRCHRRARRQPLRARFAQGECFAFAGLDRSARRWRWLTMSFWCARAAFWAASLTKATWTPLAAPTRRSHPEGRNAAEQRPLGRLTAARRRGPPGNARQPQNPIPLPQTPAPRPRPQSSQSNRLAPPLLRLKIVQFARLARYNGEHLESRRAPCRLDPAQPEKAAH
jgi:hypothetical protein